MRYVKVVAALASDEFPEDGLGGEGKSLKMIIPTVGVLPSGVADRMQEARAPVVRFEIGCPKSTAACGGDDASRTYRSPMTHYACLSVPLLGRSP